MGMRPADLQNIISRTHDIERVQRVSEESSRLQQIAFATELLRRKEQEKRQVNESPRAEGGRIQDNTQEENSRKRNPVENPGEGRPGEGKGGRSRGNGKHPERGGKTDIREGKGSIIDVEV
ncbi:MAG TPA: hypothetical protein GX506_09725 [Firmicutes bacterium]|nr:hypothetical protein [Bacillota bacterium]